MAALGGKATPPDARVHATAGYCLSGSVVLSQGIVERSGSRSTSAATNVTLSLRCRIGRRLPTETADWAALSERKRLRRQRQRRMASSLHPKGGGISMSTRAAAAGHYIIASDFDQTLSFNDSGLVLSELIGVSNFREKVAGLSDIHLVQQGAELAYLLRHDPEFRCVRREHLIETGKQVRLKKDIKRFVEWLDAGADEYHFSFYVIAAAPRAVVQSALEGIVPPDHIYGAECEYDASSGEICAVTKVPAGYGKVAILEAP